ncbi:polysaccharide biosynthesis C-terminal domain-containing protein [Ignavibacterium album]|uniref:polysaccharide biosynthesis C-terminal domain-containing protein n=1 Tax=Ignavibacterium album TaxID=591197 RepID=UPI0038B3BED6
MSSLMGYTLVAAGKPNYSFHTNLLRTVVGFVLSIPLIYLWGYMGAIYSLLSSSILGFFISKYYLEKVSLSIKVWEILRSFLLVLIFIFIIKCIDNFYIRSLSVNVIIVFLLSLIYLLIESEFREKLIQSWNILIKSLKQLI